jgi:ribosome-associated translation inhibitor RaiA
MGQRESGPSTTSHTIPMKTTVTRLGVLVSKYPDSWVATRLAGIATRRQIDEARVRLARHRDLSPAFQVSIHLVTPGPDLFADASDHTMQAAFDKALAELDGTLAERVAKRAKRHKDRELLRRGGKAS